MSRKLLFCAWVLLVLALVGSASTYAAQQAGRFKDDGNGGCVFDPNDDGPDQCFPTSPGTQLPGRFKDDGNGGCFFDPNDDGPNQCTPPAGTSSTSSSTESTSRLVATASKPRG